MRSDFLDPNLEVEASLIICSDKPERVARQIAKLPSIGNYRLLPHESKIIHDLYLDTPDHALEKQKLALRIRKIEETSWVTLKGQSQPIDIEGAVKRLEIEMLWSEDALIRIIKELTERGIKIFQQFKDFEYARPVEIMGDFGLEVIQDRESHREFRKIVEKERKNSFLAELAIDSVIYHLSSKKIYHYEVEIEEKKKGSLNVIKTVAEGLLALYRPVLRKWEHSKLATGKAIEKMLDEGSLEDLLDINNKLLPAAYDKIDDYLNRSII